MQLSMGLTSLGEALQRNCSEHCLKMLTKKAALVPASPPQLFWKKRMRERAGTLSRFSGCRDPAAWPGSCHTIDSPAWRTGRPGSCPADGGQGRDLPSQGSPSQEPAGRSGSRQPGTRILKGSLHFYNGRGSREEAVIE